MRFFLWLVLICIALPAAAETSLFADNPLVAAVTANDLDAAKAALMADTNPNSLAGNGKTVLMLAAEKGRIALMQLLLDHRADTARADALGNTPLIYAAGSGQTDAVDVLIKAGADINTPNRQGLTALMAAARNGNAAIVAHLLDAGARRDQPDFSGRTALDWAQDSRSQGTITLLR